MANARLRELQALRLRFDPEARARRLELLRALRRIRLTSARDVSDFHELLCFARAYPDGPELLAEVETQLGGFARRADLRRRRRALEDSGIAGTEIRFRFFWPMARWLCRRWPDRLRVDWARFSRKRDLEKILPFLVSYSETPALDELALSPREWLEKLRAPGETDAAFLVRRFEALAAEDSLREALYDRHDPALRLRPGPDTPSRTRAFVPLAPTVFQSAPLATGRPDLAREAARVRLRVRVAPPELAQRLIDLAHESMVTRSRDLDVFSNADPRDVRLVDCGDGLSFACFGARPERRLLLESVYGFLTLKNGVPIGYVLTAALFGSAEIAYNVFDSFRGAEAAHVFARVLAMTRRLFGARTFSIDPYQLGGLGNTEGLRSGAWWFYYKLGFRPRDPDVKRVLRGELARMKADPRHRSDAATLGRLASAHLHFSPGAPSATTLGELSPGETGLRVARLLAERWGSDRERGLRECSREGARRLRLRSLAGWSAGERLWWRRWSPLLALLPEIERWNAAERRAAVEVIRAKGGVRESDFVRALAAHRRLQRGIRQLATLD